MEKLCKKCHSLKNLDEFSPDNRVKDGRQSKCKFCMNEERKDYRKEHGEECREKSRTRYKTNPEPYKISANIYRENNHDKIIEKKREHYQLHKEEDNARSRKWAKDNPEKKKETNRNWISANEERCRVKKKEWNEANIEICRESWRKYKRKKLQELSFRLSHNMSAAISASLVGNKNGRHWELIVGFSLDELKEHLESQFVENMSWNNYGEWHIDHVIPKSKFNYISFDDIEFKKCWSLNNLQPLWAFDNLSKGARII